MAEKRKWSAVPALLNELDRLRQLASNAEPTTDGMDRLVGCHSNGPLLVGPAAG